jgi:diguanylate cyclase (GGDEF)-like protein
VLEFDEELCAMTAELDSLLPRRDFITGIAVAATLIIGYFDYVTGPDWGFSLFYLAPIVTISWVFGRGPGLLLALAAALLSLFAEVGWDNGDVPWVSRWNAITHLVIFSGAAWLLAHLRDNQARLRRLLDVESRLARTDPLTGLANVRSLMEQTQRRRRQEDAQRFTVLYIDIDDFKSLNDAYGHLAGDEFLRSVGEAIRDTIRGGDDAARVGGDEFVIVVREVDIATARAIAERLIARIRTLAAGFPNAAVAASVGLAQFEHFPAEGEDILRRADAAMYRAKADGKGRVVEWPLLGDPPAA